MVVVQPLCLVHPLHVAPPVALVPLTSPSPANPSQSLPDHLLLSTSERAAKRHLINTLFRLINTLVNSC